MFKKTFFMFNVYFLFTKIEYILIKQRKMEDCKYYIFYYQDGDNGTFLSVLISVLSTMGIILSSVGLVVLVLTAILFAEWRRNYKNQLLVQFMIARFFYTLLRYFCDILIVFRIEKFTCPLKLTSLPKLYTEMALVTWMFVFSKQMYEHFVRVFAVKTPSIWKVSACGWLLPAFVSTVLSLSITLPKTRQLCFYFFYLITLKWPILCSNGFFLVLVLKSILGANKSKTESNTRIVIVMVTLIFTFCFQQAFHDIYKLVYFIFKFVEVDEYIPVVITFTNILSVYHCAFSIMFWLFANKRTRVLWGISKDKSPPIYQIEAHVQIKTCNTIT